MLYPYIYDLLIIKLFAQKEFSDLRPFVIIFFQTQEEKMGFINSMTKQNGRTMVENGNIWTSLDSHRMETIRNRYPDTNKKEKEVKCDFTITAAKKKEEEENEKFADRIEMFARVFFPLVYTTFNVFYWLTYLRRDVQE